jgi:hypothetical protein
MHELADSVYAMAYEPFFTRSAGLVRSTFASAAIARRLMFTSPRSSDPTVFLCRFASSARRSCDSPRFSRIWRNLLPNATNTGFLGCTAGTVRIDPLTVYTVYHVRIYGSFHLTAAIRRRLIPGQQVTSWTARAGELIISVEPLPSENRETLNRRGPEHTPFQNTTQKSRPSQNTTPLPSGEKGEIAHESAEGIV